VFRQSSKLRKGSVFRVSAVHTLLKWMIFSVLYSVMCRPVSESESERQRARNGASESERDFSRVRATIHIRASRSERNLEWDVIFRFILLYIAE